METAVTVQLRAPGEKDQTEVLEPLIRSFFLSLSAPKRHKLPYMGR